MFADCNSANDRGIGSDRGAGLDQGVHADPSPRGSRPEVVGERNTRTDEHIISNGNSCKYRDKVLYFTTGADADVRIHIARLPNLSSLTDLRAGSDVNKVPKLDAVPQRHAILYDRSWVDESPATLALHLGLNLYRLTAR